MTALPETVDILIIGAGLAGTATAWALREKGISSMAILEKESSVGQHSSGRNACILRQELYHPSLQALADEGAAVLRTGELANLRMVGSFLLGYGGKEDVSERCHWATGRGTFYPNDGILDVVTLLRSYIGNTDVYYETEMLQWTSSEDGIVVQTNRGSITCKTLVNAAGPWAGQLGGLPLQPINRHIYVTEECDDVQPDWPLVWDDDHGYYFRPEGRSLWLSPCDEQAAEPGDYQLDPQTAEDLSQKLRTYQPTLPALPIQRCWVGQRTFAADREFVLGPDPREPRFVWAAALGGHGVTCSPSVGKLLAEIILGESETPAEFLPERLIDSSSNTIK